MTAIVSKLWMMSLQACVLILIVLAARFFLRKYPRVYSYCLWAIVGLRLLCPIWVELPAGLSVPLPGITVSSEQIPDAGDVADNALNLGAQAQKDNTSAQVQQPVQNTQAGQSAQNTTNMQNNSGSEAESRPEVMNPASVEEPDRVRTAVLPKVLTGLYLAGVMAVAAVYLVQYLLLKRRVSTAVLGKGNVWFCERISTPFVMGVFHPQIYLPYGLDKESGHYILKHERTHIRHYDPVIRMIGVICLCLHWWNPFVWQAVHQMNQDMEMFCDEGFLLRAPLAEKKAYANALLNFAEKRNGLWVELAFGESHTEQRVKNILYRKKEGAVSIVVVVLVMLLCGCSFLTESPEHDGSEENRNSGGNMVSGENIPDDGSSEDKEGAGSGEEQESINSSDEASAEEAQIYGTWTIADWIRPSGIYALSDEQIQEILGIRLEYTEDSCKRSYTGTAGTVETVTQYTKELITGEQLAEDFRENAEALGVAGKELQYYQVDWDGTDILGQFFYLIDDNNALVYYEGVFFKAERAWYESGRAETSGAPIENQSFVLDEQDKAFLQSMCYYMPEWAGYASIDEAFWEEFLFRSFTSPSLSEEGKAMTICGEAEVVSVYREDLGFTESQVKVSKEAVAEYTKLAIGCEPLNFEPAFEDMEPGRTALYYEDGYYYIGFSDFGSVGYTFKDCQVHEEIYDTYAFVTFDEYEDVPEEVIGTPRFMIYPADNQNGFTIISKEYLSE